MKSYNPAVYLWSEGEKTRCSFRAETGRATICAVVEEGTRHRVFDSKPISFIANCLNKRVDFCMPLNYNIPCGEETLESIPECGA